MTTTLPCVILTLLLNPSIRVGIQTSHHVDAAAQRAELAKDLSQPREEDRQKAIDAIVASPKAVLPWLLEWSRCSRRATREACDSPPPARVWVLRDNFYSAMAQIFGRLGVKEAVPFLVREIDVDTRFVRPRGSLPVDRGSPAIKALIEIGKEATPELLRRFAGLKACDDETCGLQRLAVVIALAGVADPRARPALMEASKRSGPERLVAVDGLRSLLSPAKK